MPKHQIPLNNIYRALFKLFGPQHWWPGNTEFEIIVGAILTQNTNWKNVEKAILNLKKARILTPQKLHPLSVSKLAQYIKPAGYFNVKAKRLKNFLDFLFAEYKGRLDLMEKEECSILRKKLLNVNGIGPETADSILLYAFNKPIFVVDAYTKRFMQRHKWTEERHDYHDIQNIFHAGLKTDQRYFNEYHALIVRLGKDFCRSTKKCEGCPLNQKEFWK